MRNILVFIVQKVFSFFGFRISRIDDLDKFLIRNDVRNLVIPNTMLPRARLKSFLLLINRVCSKNIQGAIVECGVWKGGSMTLAALYLKSFFRSKIELHLFDVFADICQPDAKYDGKRAIQEAGGIENASGKFESSGIYDKLGLGYLSGNHVYDRIVNTVGYPSSKVIIHEGWFHETLPVAEIDKISILRLDGDWYASTKICLEYLYDKVVDGGIIIIDDYYAYEGCQKAVDEFLIARNLYVRFNTIDSDAIFWTKN